MSDELCSPNSELPYSTHFHENVTVDISSLPVPSTAVLVTSTSSTSSNVDNDNVDDDCTNVNAVDANLQTTERANIDNNETTTEDPSVVTNVTETRTREAEARSNVSGGPEVTPDSPSTSSSSSSFGSLSSQQQQQQQHRRQQRSLQLWSSPKFPVYEHLYTRLRSFNRDSGSLPYDWPYVNDIQVFELAQTGFYYCGVSDITVCYMCGLALTNWGNVAATTSSHTSSLWEHRYWKSNCAAIVRAMQHRGTYIPRNFKPYTRRVPEAEKFGIPVLDDEIQRSRDMLSREERTYEELYEMLRSTKNMYLDVVARVRSIHDYLAPLQNALHYAAMLVLEGESTGYPNDSVPRDEEERDPPHEQRDTRRRGRNIASNAPAANRDEDDEDGDSVDYDDDDGVDEEIRNDYYRRSQEIARIIDNWLSHARSIRTSYVMTVFECSANDAVTSAASSPSTNDEGTVDRVSGGDANPDRNCETDEAPDTSTESRCVVCLYAPRCMLFMPCRHLVCCDTCTRRLFAIPAISTVSRTESSSPPSSSSSASSSADDRNRRWTSSRQYRTLSPSTSLAKDTRCPVCRDFVWFVVKVIV